MRYEVKIGDLVGWDATTGDKITYTHNGKTIHATVIDTYPNFITFETTAGRTLHGSYQELRDHGAAFTYLRPKCPLPSFSLGGVL